MEYVTGLRQYSQRPFARSKTCCFNLKDIRLEDTSVLPNSQLLHQLTHAYLSLLCQFDERF